MLVYATIDDLTDWTGQLAPDNATVLLREASVLVADATKADVYDVQPSGLPLDTDKLDALRDATCAHAALWAALGVDPLAGRGGLAAVEVSSSIDGASVATNAADLARDAADSLDELCGAGLRLLRLAGLASGQVISW